MSFLRTWYPHMPANRQIYRLLFFACLFCVFVRLRISQARIRLGASNFARWFIGVLGRKSPILGNFAPPEAQNRTNRRAAASIADRRQSPPLTARSPSVEGTGVYQTYLPSACVDIRPSLKTDVLVQHPSGDGDEGDPWWISRWTTNWRDNNSHEPSLHWWYP